MNHEARWQRLFRAAVDVSFGTVWRVREEFWQGAFSVAGYLYDENSRRLWHPGVSLRSPAEPVRSPYDYVPLLHGTTGDGGPVVARGLTREQGPAHPTSFGRIVAPALAAIDDITRPAPDADPDRPARYWQDYKIVSANLDKPRFSPAESAALRTWAVRRRLL